MKPLILLSVLCCILLTACTSRSRVSQQNYGIYQGDTIVSTDEDGQHVRGASGMHYSQMAPNAWGPMLDRPEFHQKPPSYMPPPFYMPPVAPWPYREQKLWHP